MPLLGPAQDELYSPPAFCQFGILPLISMGTCLSCLRVRE